MTLDKLTTPFETRKVLQYGKDGCKVVRHLYEMQHISGPLYKGREIKNEYGETEFDLFLFFPEAPVGILYQYKMIRPERYSVDDLMRTIRSAGLDCVDSMRSALDGNAARCGFIGNLFVEFFRQFDAESAQRYADARQAYLDRKEKEAREEAARQAREEVERKAREQAEREAERNKLLGWADGMSDLRFGNVMKTLDVLIRLDGILMTKREFVIRSVSEGWKPQKRDNQTSWYKSDGEWKESKPKTTYHLRKGEYSYTVSKTEHDFAVYLADRMEVLK